MGFDRWLRRFHERAKFSNCMDNGRTAVSTETTPALEVFQMLPDCERLCCESAEEAV